MPEALSEPALDLPTTHFRWSRVEDSEDFFCDADRLRQGFCLLGAGCALLALLLWGLWRLQTAALAPPVFVGIAHGQIFTGAPLSLAEVHDDDFDLQLADTVEVLFGRTERGQPPEIADFCAPEVVTAVSRAYQEATSKYPAGFVQTLALLESKVISTQPGFRRMYYRGLLSSRSVAAAQTSPIYLDATFVIGPPTALNTAGWRLMKLEALARDDFYRREHEKSVRRALSLPPLPVLK
jgi:hypothetical protein